MGPVATHRCGDEAERRQPAFQPSDLQGKGSSNVLDLLVELEKSVVDNFIFEKRLFEAFLEQAGQFQFRHSD